MNPSIACYFVRGGWKFYADTAEGRAQCAREYGISIGYTGADLVCSDTYEPRTRHGVQYVNVVIESRAATSARAA